MAGLLASGYNGGAWDGAGIMSTAAQTSGLALGYADGADGVVDGLAAGQIRIQPALPGDITLDGKVDGDDYDWFLLNYGTTNGAVWTMGDFTYDGRVDGDDYDWFLLFYGQSGPLFGLSQPSGTSLVVGEEPEASGRSVTAGPAALEYGGLSGPMAGMRALRATPHLRPGGALDLADVILVTAGPVRPGSDGGQGRLPGFDGSRWQATRALPSMDALRSGRQNAADTAWAADLDYDLGVLDLLASVRPLR